MANLYKVVEVFPQAKVRLIHRVLADSEEQAKHHSGDLAIATQQDIDFGGEAWTESVELAIEDYEGEV